MAKEKDHRAASFHPAGTAGEAVRENASDEDRHGELKSVPISPITKILAILGEIRRQAEIRADEILQQQRKADSGRTKRRKRTGPGRPAPVGGG